MRKQLYIGEHCPSAPVQTVAQFYDQRADELAAGETGPWYPGHAVLHDRAHAAKLRRTGADRLMQPFAGRVFLHVEGPRDDGLVCPCGHWADFLCDTPIGRGRTCDRPMCHCCRDQVGEDLDRCAYHRALGR